MPRAITELSSQGPPTPPPFFWSPLAPCARLTQQIHFLCRHTRIKNTQPHNDSLLCCDSALHKQQMVPDRLLAVESRSNSPLPAQSA